MSNDRNPNPESFLDALHLLIARAHESDKIQIREIFEVLSGKGYATLLILFSFPFCIPLQIPGFSTPFGIILGFLGLRLAFAKRLWWPNWVLKREFKSENVEKLSQNLIKVASKLQIVIRPRLLLLTQPSIARRVHGVLIFILAVLLSLPLPIPFTNMLAALPIIFIGFGLLEDDGVFIIIGYFFAAFCLIAFVSLFLLGKAQITRFYT